MDIALAVLIRAITIYIIMHIIVSIIGARGLSKMTIKDYIIGIAMGGVAGRGITKIDQPFIAFFTALVSLAIIHFIFSYFSLKSEFLRRLDNGEPLILIQNGRVLQHNLKKAKISINELYSLLRQKDVFNFSDVEYALLEASGAISVLLVPDKQPVNVKQLKINVHRDGLPILVIKEGKIIAEELKKANLSEQWLQTQLQQLNINNISDIFMAQADKSGITYICFYSNEAILIPQKNN